MLNGPLPQSHAELELLLDSHDGRLGAGSVVSHAGSPADVAHLVIPAGTLSRRALVETAAATVSGVIAAGILPAALEMMDAAAVAAVEAVRPMGLAPDVGALLVARCDSGGAGEAARVGEIMEATGAAYVAVTDDPDEGEALMAALIEDVGVPVPQIPALLAGVAEVAERHRTAIPVIGHAGDGNFHPLITFDASDPAATQRARAAFDDIMGIALALSGTVTGEHGVGILKAHRLGDQLGEDVLEVMGRIKAALDPEGILNPGKWI